MTAAPIELHKFTAAGGAEAARLDIWLSEQMGGLTRSQVKRLIDQGQVLVNGKRCKAGYRLQAGGMKLKRPAPTGLSVA